MNKILTVIGCMALVVATVSCNKTRRNTGRTYMPDMAYSRAYETYASTEALDKAGVHYTARPVDGTIARGEMAAYPYKNDSIGYVKSAEVKNPFDSAAVDMKEAERLYLVNCAICHGTKLDGNGPLWKDGNGPFPSKPIALAGDAKYVAMTAGTMFHSVTYGKNAMGSYASQLSTKQRWEVIAYIKSKQKKVVNTATAAPAADSAAKK
ncbi:MAG: cytochrome c [Chitinophagaceae bacterium]|nr:cytochrome c [Chitinophagaceae bacterium]